MPSNIGLLAPLGARLGCAVGGVAGGVGESETHSAGAAGVKTDLVATGFVGVEMAPIRDPLTGFCRRDRLAGLRPSSRWSHRRIVSRPISMPIRRRPPTNDSTDSPAWASRSNSSRCGSNWAVAWLRGCRAWATAWDSVVGRAVASGEWMGSDMGADGAQYAWWSGGARGAPRAQSKRQRLDVGVLPYFLFFLLDELSHLWCSYVGWLSGLVDSLSFGFRSLVKWWCYGSLVEPLELDLSVVYSGRYLGRSPCAQGLVFGGGGC